MKQEDKENKVYKFYMMSQQGIVIKNPNEIIQQVWMMTDDKPYTWAEKQRDKIIWRRKVIKVWMNRIIVVGLGLILSATELYLSLLLADFIGSHPIASLIGIADGGFIILIFLHLADLFETDPNYVRLRKKK